MNFKIIPIFIMVLSLIFLGCVGEKPGVTPVPTLTATPTATPTPEPTIVPTIVQPTPTPAIVRTQALYTSDVDELYGFRRVTVRNGSSNYTNRILTINASDTVKWVSVTDAGYSLTLVSQEGLWDNSSSRMKYAFSWFNYTFSNPGNYEVYIKEFPKVAHQKIIVNP
jgi:plastocyanin